MLHVAKLLVLLSLATALARAESPALTPGYWHLINTTCVFRVDAAGQLTFLNTGASGQLVLATDQTFAGTFAETPISGKLADGKLWLRRSAEPTPAALEYLECRAVDEATAREIIRHSRTSHPPSSNLPRALRTSIANALRQRLELLAEAVMFHCLEYNLTKVGALSDLVGPEKQLSALPSIDGEDYRQLDLTPNASWTIESASGIKVTYPH